MDSNIYVTVSSVEVGVVIQDGAVIDTEITAVGPPATINGLQAVTISEGSNIDLTQVEADFAIGVVPSPTFETVAVDTVTPTLTTTPGQMGWNTVDGTIDLRLLNNTTLQVGEEMYYYAKASEAIANGELCQFNGVQGDHLLIKKAVPAEIKTDPQLLMGVATQPIGLGEFGYVTWFGKINGVYTTGWSAGDILYPSPTTAGALTNVEPVAPNVKSTVAVVIKEATGGAENGVLFVRPVIFNGLHSVQDVHIDTPTNGQALIYDGADARWENKNFATIPETCYLPVDFNMFRVTSDTVASANLTIPLTKISGTLSITSNQITLPKGYYYEIDMNLGLSSTGAAQMTIANTSGVAQIQRTQHAWTTNAHDAGLTSTPGYGTIDLTSAGSNLVIKAMVVAVTTTPPTLDDNFGQIVIRKMKKVTV